MMDEALEELAESIAFIVALRTEDDGEVAVPHMKQLGLEAEFLPAPLASVSSSQIREQVRAGQPGKGLDDDVRTYIDHQSLYS